MTYPGPDTPWPRRLGIAALGLLAGLCVILGACSWARTVEVQTTRTRGTATVLYATASHVVSGHTTALVDDGGRRVLCDVRPLTQHPAPWGPDGVSLLLPRGEPWSGVGVTWPGDSGRPVWDAQGRLAWLHLGRDGGEQVVTPVWPAEVTR